MVGYYFSGPLETNRGRYFARIEEISEIKIKGINTIPFRVVKEFNTQGRIVSSVTFNSVGGRTVETYWRYINDLKFSYKKHRSFANIVGWREEEVIIEYDEQTLSPQKIELKKDGVTIQKATLNLDSLGRIESAWVFDGSGRDIFTERVIYLPQSNMIRVMVYRANGQFFSTSSYPLDPSKEFTSTSVYREYYPNGDVKIETLASASKGDQAYYYEYQYDSQGNWVVRDTYQVNLGKNNSIRKKVLEYRVTRTITYH